MGVDSLTPQAVLLFVARSHHYLWNACDAADAVLRTA